MTANTNDGTTNQANSGSQSQSKGQSQSNGTGTQGFDQYPKWNKTWQDKLGKVDEQIINYYNQDNPDQDGLPGHIGRWFENQGMDNDSLTEYSKAKSSPDFMKPQIQSRVDYLGQQGKLKNYTGQQSQSPQYAQQGQSTQAAAGGQPGQAGQADQSGKTSR